MKSKLFNAAKPPCKIFVQKPNQCPAPTLLQFDKEKNIVKRKGNYLDAVYKDTTPQGHQNRYRRSAVKNSRSPGQQQQGIAGNKINSSQCTVRDRSTKGGGDRTPGKVGNIKYRTKLGAKDSKERGARCYPQRCTVYRENPTTPFFLVLRKEYF